MKKQNNFFEKLFSTQGILLIIAGLMAYWIFFKEDPSSKNNTKQLATYQSQNAPIGIGNTINAEALKDFQIDLTKDLDPKLIPDVIEESLKEVSQSGVQEANFIPAFVAKVSQKIQQISTIDLNEDGLTDPILVIPENFSQSGETFQLSIRIPDPTQVTSFPSGSDQEAWKNIAENQSFELLNTAVIRQGKDELMLQTTANQQLYPSGTPYYQRSIGFTDVLLTSLLVQSIFSPPLYYPFGYGGYYPVRDIQQSRGGYGYESSTSSQTAAKDKTGKAIGTSTKKPPTSSLNQVKTKQYTRSNSQQRQQRQRSGFGKSNSNSRQKAQTRRRSSNRSFRPSRSSRRSFGGFGRRRR